jgi:hypothetical protein
VAPSACPKGQHGLGSGAAAGSGSAHVGVWGAVCVGVAPPPGGRARPPAQWQLLLSGRARPAASGGWIRMGLGLLVLVGLPSEGWGRREPQRRSRLRGALIETDSHARTQRQRQGHERRDDSAPSGRCC